jgi:hypothetical protein
MQLHLNDEERITLVEALNTAYLALRAQIANTDSHDPRESLEHTGQVLAASTSTPARGGRPPRCVAAHFPGRGVTPAGAPALHYRARRPGARIGADPCCEKSDTPVPACWCWR